MKESVLLIITHIGVFIFGWVMAYRDYRLKIDMIKDCAEGYCERCGKLLFEGDNYIIGPEGDYFCGDCQKQLIEKEVINV